MANDALDTDNAWDLVLSAINRSNITLPVPGSDQPAVKINGKSWELVQPASEQARNLLSLFLPLCQPVTNNSRVIGQLGQSLDGRIATVTGCSRFSNGDDGITHTTPLMAADWANANGHSSYFLNKTPWCTDMVSTGTSER